MGCSRRLSAALLVSAVSLALATLVTAVTVTGGGERRVAVEASAGGAATLEVQHTEVALTPAKRQQLGAGDDAAADATADAAGDAAAGLHAGLVLVAVLAVLVGLAAAAARPAPSGRVGRPLHGAHRRTVRLRGPPVLSFS